MNFLLHLHLAARDLGAPAAGAGAMLPDLWRIADRRVRARPARAIEGAHEGALREVLAGIEHHLAVDCWFHADAVFLDGEREAARLLREAQLTAPRAALFAHVLWELCLDGALVRREGASIVLGALKGAIGAVDRGVHGRAAELHHFAHVTRGAGEREAFDARLARILAELARGPWALGYADGEGVAERISGARVGLGLTPLDAGDHARLAAVAEALLDRGPAALARIEQAAEVC